MKLCLLYSYIHKYLLNVLGNIHTLYSIHSLHRFKYNNQGFFNLLYLLAYSKLSLCIPNFLVIYAVCSIL